MKKLYYTPNTRKDFRKMDSLLNRTRHAAEWDEKLESFLFTEKHFEIIMEDLSPEMQAITGVWEIV